MSDITPEFLRAQTGKATHPSPFFDVATTYMPKNIKELFKWCLFYFYTHPIINQVISKRTEYYVKDLIIETDDEDLKKKYEGIIKDLGLRRFLIEHGMDCDAYGNGFVSIYFPFKRELVCKNKKCGAAIDIKKAEYKVRGKYALHGKCLKCGTPGEFEMKDSSLNNAEGIRLIRWDPLNIQIEHNEISGVKFYYLAIPGRVKSGIMSGLRIYWESTPAAFIDAVRQNKWLKFEDGKIFHYKRPSLADSNMEWGKSSITPVLREVFHLYTLRKAQESIALGRIMPFDYLYPKQQGPTIEGAYDGINLDTWKTNLEEQIRKWREDPTYKPIMPIEVGHDTIGGDGKALMVYPEMQAASQSIENGLGMPSGFMSGSITYSGGNVVLRMLENSIMTDRDNRLELAQWILDDIADFMKINKVKVGMKEFKMADDTGKKEMLMALNREGKVSDNTFLNELDLCAKTEMEKILKEMADKHKKYLEVQVDLTETIQGYVNQLNEMEPGAREEVLMKMRGEIPETYNMVAERMGANGNIAGGFQRTSGRNGGNGVMPPGGRVAAM